MAYPSAIGDNGNPGIFLGLDYDEEVLLTLGWSGLRRIRGGSSRTSHNCCWGFNTGGLLYRDGAIRVGLKSSGLSPGQYAAICRPCGSPRPPWYRRIFLAGRAAFDASDGEADATVISEFPAAAAWCAIPRIRQARQPALPPPRSEALRFSGVQLTIRLFMDFQRKLVFRRSFLLGHGYVIRHCPLFVKPRNRA